MELDAGFGIEFGALYKHQGNVTYLCQIAGIGGKQLGSRIRISCIEVLGNHSRLCQLDIAICKEVRFAVLNRPQEVFGCLCQSKRKLGREVHVASFWFAVTIGRAQERKKGKKSMTHQQWSAQSHVHWGCSWYCRATPCLFWILWREPLMQLISDFLKLHLLVS